MTKRHNSFARMPKRDNKTRCWNPKASRIKSKRIKIHEERHFKKQNINYSPEMVNATKDMGFFDKLLRNVDTECLEVWNFLECLAIVESSIKNFSLPPSPFAHVFVLMSTLLSGTDFLPSTEPTNPWSVTCRLISSGHHWTRLLCIRRIKN